MAGTQGRSLQVSVLLAAPVGAADQFEGLLFFPSFSRNLQTLKGDVLAPWGARQMGTRICISGF